MPENQTAELFRAEDESWWIRTALGDLIRICSNCKEEELRSDNRSGLCSKRKECINIYKRKRIVNRKARGQCRQCASPIDKDRSELFCTEHLDKINAQITNDVSVSQAKGECAIGGCTNPIAKSRSKRLCHKHLDQDNARSTNNATVSQAKGECAVGGCTNPIAKSRSKRLCHKHLDKDKARNRNP